METDMEMKTVTIFREGELVTLTAREVERMVWEHQHLVECVEDIANQERPGHWASDREYAQATLRTIGGPTIYSCSS